MASTVRGGQKPPPDPEMLKHLDLLLNMDVLQSEEDWQDIGDLEQDEPIEMVDEVIDKAEKNGK